MVKKVYYESEDDENVVEEANIEQQVIFFKEFRESLDTVMGYFEQKNLIDLDIIEAFDLYRNKSEDNLKLKKAKIFDFTSQ